MEKELLSIPEYASRVGISRIAVFKQVKKGKIAAIRVGRNWIIPVDKSHIYEQHINKRKLSTGLYKVKKEDINKNSSFVNKNVDNYAENLNDLMDKKMEDMGWD